MNTAMRKGHMKSTYFINGLWQWFITSNSQMVEKLVGFPWTGALYAASHWYSTNKIYII
jgi:hypothetical protein